MEPEVHKPNGVISDITRDYLKNLSLLHDECMDELISLGDEVSVLREALEICELRMNRDLRYQEIDWEGTTVQDVIDKALNRDRPMDATGAVSWEVATGAVKFSRYEEGGGG